MSVFLTFAETGGGDESGFNDPIVSPFAESSTKYNLVREVIQNSLDARRSLSDPVIVKFEIENVSIDDIPLVNEYRDHFIACQDFDRSNGQAVLFYSRAVDLTHSQTINFLKISDYNTVGLNSERAQALFGSVGRSLKSAGSGGSFGLGKGPLFACSQWRTVFACSVHLNESGIPIPLFKGKTRISSHQYAGKKRQGNGSLGLPDQSPITIDEQIPTYFRRQKDKVGTDLWIAAYDEYDLSAWKKNLIKPVLECFWLSIFNNRLQVQVGSTEINSETLQKLLEDYYPRHNSSSKDEPRQYYETYMGVLHRRPDHYHFREHLPILGEVNLYLRLQDGDNSVISHHRTPLMTIYTSRLTHAQDFTGVLIDSDQEGNEFLRRCEDPHHSEWKEKNYVSLEPLESGITLSTDQVRDSLRSIKTFIRDSITSVRAQDETEILDVLSLRELLPLDPDLGRYSSNNNTLKPSKDGIEIAPSSSTPTQTTQGSQTIRSAVAYVKSYLTGASSQDGSFVTARKQRKPIKKQGNAMRLDAEGTVDVPNVRADGGLVIRHVVKNVTQEGTIFSIIATANHLIVVDIQPMIRGESAGSEMRLNLKWAKADNGSSLMIKDGVICGVVLNANSPLHVSVLTTDTLKHRSITFLFRKGARL